MSSNSISRMCEISPDLEAGSEYCSVLLGIATRSRTFVDIALCLKPSLCGSRISTISEHLRMGF